MSYCWQKSLHHLGPGMICQATVGSSATSRVRNVWKRRGSVDVILVAGMFWISICDMCFFLCHQFQIRKAFPMIINIPQDVTPRQSQYMTIKLGDTCKRKFVQPLNLWLRFVVEPGPVLFAHLRDRDSPFHQQKTYSKLPGSTTNHWLILFSLVSILSNQNS